MKRTSLPVLFTCLALLLFAAQPLQVAHAQGVVILSCANC
jgi:hypothetical protein